MRASDHITVFLKAWPKQSKGLILMNCKATQKFSKLSMMQENKILNKKMTLQSNNWKLPSMHAELVRLQSHHTQKSLIHSYKPSMLQSYNFDKIYHIQKDNTLHKSSVIFTITLSGWALLHSQDITEIGTDNNFEHQVQHTSNTQNSPYSQRQHSSNVIVTITSTFLTLASPTPSITFTR